MKIIKSKKNICWRKYNLNTDVSSIVKDFDEILKNDSFVGLKKINKRLNLKNLVNLKVSKKEFKESSNYLNDKEKFALYEAIKNISFVSKSQLNSLTKTISPINGLSIWD